MAEEMIAIKMKVEGKFKELLEEFERQSKKSPAEFTIWWTSLDESDAMIIDGLCNAAALGMNDRLFDMSKFDENKKQLEKEAKEEK